MEDDGLWGYILPNGLLIFRLPLLRKGFVFFLPGLLGLLRKLFNILQTDGIAHVIGGSLMLRQLNAHSITADLNFCLWLIFLLFHLLGHFLQKGFLQDFSFLRGKLLQDILQIQLLVFLREELFILVHKYLLSGQITGAGAPLHTAK